MFRCANPRPKNQLKAKLGLGLAKLRVLGYFQGVPVFWSVPVFLVLVHAITNSPTCPAHKIVFSHSSLYVGKLLRLVCLIHHKLR